MEEWEMMRLEMCERPQQQGLGLPPKGVGKCQMVLFLFF